MLLCCLKFFIYIPVSENKKSDKRLFAFCMDVLILLDIFFELLTSNEHFFCSQTKWGYETVFVTFLPMAVMMVVALKCYLVSKRRYVPLRTKDDIELKYGVTSSNQPRSDENTNTRDTDQSKMKQFSLL